MHTRAPFKSFKGPLPLPPSKHIAVGARMNGRLEVSSLIYQQTPLAAGAISRLMPRAPDILGATKPADPMCGPRLLRDEAEKIQHFIDSEDHGCLHRWQ